MKLNVKMTAVEVEGGYQTLITFSDDRSEMRGPIETKEDCEARVEAAATDLANSIMQDILAGEKGSLKISRGEE